MKQFKHFSNFNILCIDSSQNGIDQFLFYAYFFGDCEYFLRVLSNRPFTFSQVIQGYEQGVPGMCLGEIRTLTVPPELGYGARGVPGTIPADATLHFTVKLMNVQETPNSNAEL